MDVFFLIHNIVKQMFARASIWTGGFKKIWPRRSLRGPSLM
jgi:hypothetical protein